MTRADLARRMNRSEQTIAHWERGTSHPCDSAQRSLCFALGCSSDDLYSRMPLDAGRIQDAGYAGPYGSFYGEAVFTLEGEPAPLRYPISRTTKEALVEDLKTGGYERFDRRPWLTFGSLDNRHVAINHAFMCDVAFFPGAATATPWRHPVFYHALEQLCRGMAEGAPANDNHAAPEAMEAKRHLDRLDPEARALEIKRHSCLRLLRATGLSDWFPRFDERYILSVLEDVDGAESGSFICLDDERGARGLTIVSAAELKAFEAPRMRLENSSERDICRNGDGRAPEAIAAKANGDARGDAPSLWTHFFQGLSRRPH